MKLTHLVCSSLLALGSVAAARTTLTPTPPPATPKKPVTDHYGPLAVVDEYRWLEDVKDPAVHEWADAQNARTRQFLSSLPGRDVLAQQLTAILKSRSPSYGQMMWRGGQLFATKRQPPKQQRFLVVRPRVDGDVERVLLDPMVLDPSGATAIDWWVPSRDGKLIAVSLSKNGSERGDLHVYDVATGKALPDVIEHVQNGTAGGSATFNADASGIYYTRYPRPGERPAADLEAYQQVWFHKLGAPVGSDTYQLGKDLPRIAEIALSGSLDGRYLLGTVENGDGGDFELFLLGPDGKWRQLSKFEDRVIGGTFGRGDDHSLYVISLKGAPLGRVLRLALPAASLEQATVVVPEGDGAIAGLRPMDKRLWVLDIAGGPSRLRSFSLDGKDEKTVATPPVSGLGPLVALDGDELLFNVHRYVAPSAWYLTSPSLAQPKMTSLRETSPVDLSDIEVTRGTAKSKDGTKVPFTVLAKKGTPRDGNNATILTGYGGFGIAQTPGFQPTLSPWLHAGGVYVIANLRGGGEYGDAWHKAGMLTRKQNVFDDFIAVAEQIIADKWTRPARLDAQGGSNGGLLMGAVLTQRPDLFHAVVSAVGIYDMLRTENTPNGRFNVTEYGSVSHPDELKALYAYSPYHHVVDGKSYPAVLFTTGDNDPRVDPMHSRKMVARLQAASKSGQPILLRTSAKTGHGVGSPLDEIVGLMVDVAAFHFAELGLTPR